MLKTFTEAVEMINSGKLLHIAAGEKLLRRLPKGEWIGGSTEYFLEKTGGLITGDMLDIIDFDCSTYNIAVYDADSICDMLTDAYSNGFSLMIVPHGSEVMNYYAKNAVNDKNAFLMPVVGWVSGVGVGAAPDESPVTVNGRTGEVFTDKAIVLHVSLPEDKTVVVNLVNVFSPDENSPVIRFEKDGFTVEKCYIDGVETDFSDFLKERAFNTSLPIVGDYSGENINITVRSIGDGEVRLYAPVFKDIDYRFAMEVDNYAEKLTARISQIDTENTMFACNCYLSFVYGSLEGKDVGAFYGPVTFGEIAYLLVNQTLVYLQVL